MAQIISNSEGFGWSRLGSFLFLDRVGGGNLKSEVGQKLNSVIARHVRCDEKFELATGCIVFPIQRLNSLKKNILNQFVMP